MDNIAELKKAGLVIEGNLSEADRKRLESLEEKEVKSLVEIVKKVNSGPAHGQLVFMSTTQPPTSRGH
jgi:hypothetical protein